MSESGVGVPALCPHTCNGSGCVRAGGSRVTIETGSFFERVPAGGDAYLLWQIISARCAPVGFSCQP
jgi:hypothetical protein